MAMHQHEGKGGHVHTVPAGRRGPEHVTRGTDCWCIPTHYQLCSECGGDERGCWRCIDEPGPRGLTIITAEFARIVGESLVIVHNDVSR